MGTPIRLVDETGIERFRGTQSPGGGSGPILVHHTQLSDADIKALPIDGSNLPILVSPVPDAGTMILPTFIAAVGPAVAYTNIHAGGGWIIGTVAGEGSSIEAEWLQSQQQLWQLIGQSGSRSVGYASLGFNVLVSNGGGIGVFGQADGADMGYYDGSAWALWAGNLGNGDYTGGDPANKLDLYFYYVVLPTV